MFKIRTKITAKTTLLIATALPSVALALSLEKPTNLTEFVNNFLTILNGDLSRGVFGIVPFLVGFCFFAFIIGVLKYTGAGGDEERLGKAKQLIAYGLVGMVIALSFWGLAALVARTYFQV